MKTFLPILLVIVFLTCATTSCSSTDDTPAPDGDESASQPDGDLSIPGQTPGDMEKVDPEEYLLGEFVTLEPGTFTMGSPLTEVGRFDDEAEHEVTLTRRFEIQTTETLSGAFDYLLGDNPTAFARCGDYCGANYMTWHQALRYCNALSSHRNLPLCFDCEGEGKEGTVCTLKSDYNDVRDCPGYRLPTEAEWEYAARAGTSTATYLGDVTEMGCTLDPVLDRLGWYCPNTVVSYRGCRDMAEDGGPACAGPHGTANKEPNAWGLSDMLGNLGEWVWDSWAYYPMESTTDPIVNPDGESHVVRGGGWFSDASSLRAAYRGYGGEFHDCVAKGFRVVRTLPSDD